MSPDERCADWVRHRILPGFMELSSDLARQVAQLVKIDPLYLYMFPSNLEGMLRVLEKTHQEMRSLRLVFTVAETVDDALRERTRQTLGVEIADNYGTTETFIAWQCPKRKLPCRRLNTFWSNSSMRLAVKWRPVRWAEL